MIIRQDKMPSLKQVLVSNILFCSFALYGCSAIMKPVRTASHTTGDIHLNVTVVPEVNDNSPIAVDVVVVNDKDTLKLLSSFTAQVWFHKRDSFLRMHPSKIQISSWEWVPGQEVASLMIPRTGIADGVILFANYASPGDHCSVLPRNGTIDLALGTKDFKILPER
jgi:type VI secretion system protein